MLLVDSLRINLPLFIFRILVIAMLLFIHYQVKNYIIFGIYDGLWSYLALCHFVRYQFEMPS